MSTFITTKAERDYVTYCKHCSTILQFDLNDIKASCCRNDKYYDCSSEMDYECFDHMRVLYIECENKHRIYVGNRRVLFFGGTLDATPLFCQKCGKGKCECDKIIHV